MGEAPQAPPQLPQIPDEVPPEVLREADEGQLEELSAALRESERATLTAMSPYERQLREIRGRLAELATERRRRERSAQVAQRASVRQAAKAGDMPNLQTALDAGDVHIAAELPLQSIRAFLSTGGEVGFGFATRPGVIAFTDGRRQRQARTWGEARAAYADGWEPGAPGIPGVRIHLTGSRVERVVPATEVVIDPTGAGSEASG